MLRRPCLTSSGATTPHLTPVTWPIWGEHMATKMQCAQFTRAPSAMVGYHGRPRTLAKQTLMGTGKCIWIIHPTCLTQCFQHQNDPKGTNQVTYEKSCAKKKCARFYGYIFFVLVCIFCVPNLGLSTFFCTKGRSRSLLNSKSKFPHHPGFKHGAFLAFRRQAEPLDEAQGQSDSAVSQMQWNDKYVTNIDNWMCSNMQYIDSMASYQETWKVDVLHDLIMFYYVLPCFTCFFM